MARPDEHPVTALIRALMGGYADDKQSDYLLLGAEVDPEGYRFLPPPQPDPAIVDQVIDHRPDPAVVDRIDMIEKPDEFCVICGRNIFTMAFKGTGVCGEAHRKERDHESDQQRAIAP